MARPIRVAVYVLAVYGALQLTQLIGGVFIRGLSVPVDRGLITELSVG